MATCISRGPKTTSTNQHNPPANVHPNSTQQQQQYNQIIKIYTEWGNHYLEKARFKKLIQNLQTDLTDGTLLADLVEAVCDQKVKDINRRPKTPVNMVENIVHCLTLLERLGVSLDGITAKDLKEGNLKAILALFFALSKYKQQQKQRLTSVPIVSTERVQPKRQHLPSSEEMKQSRLPSPYHGQHPVYSSGTATGTSIPTPVSQRQSRAITPAGVNSLKCSSSANSSRSASPSHSFIPTPKSGVNSRSSLNEKQLSGRNSSKVPASNFNAIHQSPNNRSLLDKVKGPKDKAAKPVAVNINGCNTKRTSSSSGVSSARSERSSDSSNSLNNEGKMFSDVKDSGGDQITIGEVHVKPMLRRKVIVKPIETKSIRIPSPKVVATKVEEKSSPLTVQEYSPTTFKDENKSAVSESSRLSGSGIPKPMAAVKGMAKPTNSVAPMVIVKPDTIEKVHPNNNEDPKLEDKITMDPPHHIKQSSMGEEDEASVVNVKPMEPLLRLYKPHRITLPSNGYIGSQQRINHMQQRHYSSKNEIKRDDDYAMSSGYVSDGDVLQSSNLMTEKLYSDIDNGYMSEGGAQFYEQYNHSDIRFAKAPRKISCPPNIDDTYTSASSPSSKYKQRVPQGNILSTDVLTALTSGVSLNKFGSKINGRGLGPDEGPVSPPEPTPTNAGSYSTFRNGTPRQEPVPVVYRVVGSRSHVKKSDSGQQTDNTSFSDQNSQWNKYPSHESSSIISNSMSNDVDRSRMRNEQCFDNVRIRDKRSPSAGSQHTNTNSLLRNKTEKRRTSSTSTAGSREELNDLEYYERKSRNDGKTKVRGVPSSFGYVKRPINSNGKEQRTAQVSAVPRTKVKVSGGTQTDMKSYSMNSTNASQLSQGVRERIMMGSESSPKSPARIQNLHPPNDRDSLPGSLSDSAYTDLQIMSNHSSWFRQGSPYTASLPTRTSALAGLMDADSIESLPAQLHHRASLTHTRLLSGTSTSPSPSSPSRLSRSNSISYLRERTFPRSTKSEKLYPSMLQRSEELEPLYSSPYGTNNGSYSSQDEPPSPTPSHLSQSTSAGSSSRYNYTVSPSSSSQGYNRNSPYMNFVSKMNSKEDVHGSAVSLLSTASSSIYSSTEDKQAQEMKRLRRDLSEAQQKVHTLTSQLSTNVSFHVLLHAWAG